jgi:ATP-dependent DNA helicase RecG
MTRTLTWEDAVDRVSGLGPASREALAKVGTTTVADLVWTLPVAWEDSRAPISVGEAIARARSEPDARVCFHGVVKSAGLVPMRGRRSVRVVVGPNAGSEREAAKEAVTLWWFFAAHGVLAVATPGSAVLVTGRIRVDPGKPPRIAHPDIARDEEASRVVRPRYPRLGVPPSTLRKAIGRALDGLEAIPDFVPAAVATRERLPPASSLLEALHGRDGSLAAVPSESTRRAAVERLAWAEAFTRVWQRLTLEGGEARAPALPADRAVLARLRAELGFTLTAEQEKAIDAISGDLALPLPMRRLLLGDVGTGKTAVALAAAAQCVSAGAQVAILAPTSVLAEQYMDAVGPLARATGASVALVAAGVPAAQRRRREDGLARGTLSIAIGTHALLGEEIRFKNLGLVIVDEQHRLGVAQRLALVSKRSDGASKAKIGRPHLLTLSATPIPRTLALALRGELKTCELGDRPKGRPGVATEIRARSASAGLLGDLRAVCARGERAFVIAPRIARDDDEEADETANATELAAALAKALAPSRVGLVHGGMAPDAKREAMRAFRAGETLVLVATTVVEVGIDVPQATLMVVCDAERFGLAQLHQLRGRVGRGDQPGRCILVHGEPLEPLAEARLQALVRLARGVDVARADLELRGAGDLGGTRQSGAEEELLYIDPVSPPAWLGRIEADARHIVATDPDLTSEDHRALRIAVRRLSVAIATREEAG